MSTAGGAAALTIDVLTNLAGLGSGLAQAEAQVSQSATNMGKKVDAALGQSMGQRILGGLKGALGAAAVADLVGNLASRMNKEFGAIFDPFEIMKGGLEDFVRGIPVMGPAIMNAAGVFQKYGEELGMRFAEGLLNPSASGQTISPRFHAGTEAGYGPMMSYLGRSLLANINPIAMVATGISGTNPLLSGETFRSPFGVPVGPNEAMISGLRDELAELLAREQIRTTTDARSQMIAQRLQLGYGQVDTAFGAMKFAAGDPAKASQDILKSAQDQLMVQERIRIILETIGAQMNAGN
jgi:hypothetical protein